MNNEIYFEQIINMPPVEEILWAACYYFLVNPIDYFGFMCYTKSNVAKQSI